MLSYGTDQSRKLPRHPPPPKPLLLYTHCNINLKTERSKIKALLLFPIIRSPIHKERNFTTTAII